MNRAQSEFAIHDASAKTCAECARLWKEYFAVDKIFLKVAGDRLPLLAGQSIDLCADLRGEAEYRESGELRRAARKAIGQHRRLSHPPQPARRMESETLKAMFVHGVSL